MTDAMRRAVKWLADRGGSGVVDRHGRVMAAGDVAYHIDATTWLRCDAAQLVDFQNGRIVVIEDRRAA